MTILMSSNFYQGSGRTVGVSMNSGRFRAYWGGGVSRRVFLYPMIIPLGSPYFKLEF